SRSAKRGRRQEGQAMTREELEVLSDRELDAVVAEKVMEWKRAKAECFPGEEWWSLGDFITKRISEFQPSTDRNAAALVLEKIGELGLRQEFIEHLETEVGFLPWDLVVEATPRQLMIAAVLAWEG